MAESNRVPEHEALAERLCQEQGARFAVTAVVPVYNVAPYLPDAIESVLGQTIGCKRVQIVLVDDGSTDDSAELCRAYQERYPDTVEFVQQKHAGVSAARNAGMQHACGLYVNFFDADDKWSDDAYYEALKFLAENPSVGVAALRHRFFGAREGRHELDYKFRQTRVINIAEVADHPQMSVNNTLIRTNLLAGRSFDVNLSLAEDFLFVSQIIMDEGAYGVVESGVYHYRKRQGEVSAIDNSRKSAAFYLEVPALCSKRLFEYSRRCFGYVMPYIQYAVMYDLRWRLQGKIQADLDAFQVAEYHAILKELLEDVQDACIFSQRNMPFNAKLYAYAVKHGVEPDEVLRGASFSEGHLLLPGFEGPDGDGFAIPAGQISKQMAITFVTREAGGFRIEGHLQFLNYSAAENVTVELLVDGKESCSCKLFPRHDKSLATPFHGKALPHIGFEALVPWDGQSRIRLGSATQYGQWRFSSDFAFSKYTGVWRKRANNYWMLEDAIIRYKKHGDRGELVIEPRTAARQLVYEHRLRKELAATCKEQAASIMALRNRGLRAHAKSTGLWIISDRPFRAGDNGEALFRYLCAHPLPDVKPVFAISKDCADFERISRIGPTIDMNSPEYERALLEADLFISSSGDDAIGGTIEQVKDLLHFKYAFLQHGIIDGDLSGWINRWRKNLKLFVTSAEREAQSVAAPSYGYTHGEVKLVGLPRHDELVAKARSATPSNTIYLMPTWRDYLAPPANPKTGMRKKNPLFRQSDYFAFYEALITDERLLDLLERFDYKLQFVVHPCFQAEACEFTQSPRVIVHDSCDYQKAFLDGAFLVTDFSSVAFDFALLGKPVVYAQFDADAFFSKHSYTRGYFSFEDDGFGPICHDVRETVQAIEDLLQSHCQMNEKYKSRAQNFFFTPPESATRCSLLVEELLKLQQADARKSRKRTPLF